MPAFNEGGEKSPLDTVVDQPVFNARRTQIICYSTTATTTTTTTATDARVAAGGSHARCGALQSAAESRPRRAAKETLVGYL